MAIVLLQFLQVRIFRINGGLQSQHVLVCFISRERAPFNVPFRHDPNGILLLGNPLSC